MAYNRYSYKRPNYKPVMCSQGEAIIDRYKDWNPKDIDGPEPGKFPNWRQVLQDIQDLYDYAFEAGYEAGYEEGGQEGFDDGYQEAQYNCDCDD